MSAKKEDSLPPSDATARTELLGRIDALALIGALEDHVLGVREMTASQVSAALALLKKILPDMSSSAKTGDDEPSHKSHEEALKELE